MWKKWRKYEDIPHLREFAAKAGVSRLVAAALWHRGQRTPEAARAFLCPEEQPFHDPLLMKDMEKAVARIGQAVAGQERIIVYGDYDVDGMTATALMLHNLRALGAEVDFYIPDRKSEGYGFNLGALQKIAADGAGLLISVDCGIASCEDVAAMQEQLDIIITDHHLPGAELPPALAVVNPHREDCQYPDKNLCGAGVAFKLCQALWQKLRGQEFEGDMELVALGTVADIVPLIGENRKIVKAGLQKLQDSDFLGIRALVEVAGLKDKEISAGHIGFQLAPRLNAAGRIGSARQGVTLLLSRDIDEAESLAQELDMLNSQRQAIEQEICQRAEEQLTRGGQDPADLPALVVAGEGWNPGVIGIVASRLVDKYYKPAIVLSRQPDGVCKGSCRSIEGLHMYEALAACKAELLQFGGHEMAAGLSVREDKVDAFRRVFSEYAAGHLTEDDYIPKVTIEFEMEPSETSLELVEELARLEPYGMGNPKPLFGCRGLRGYEAQAIGGQKQHLRFQAGTQANPVTGLYWNHSELAPVINAEAVDLVYTPSVNEWNGRRYLQCQAESISPAEGERVFPERETLAAVYKYLHQLQAGQGRIPYTAAELAVAFSRARGHISYYTFSLALRIFRELDLLHESLTEQGYYLPPVAGKMDLSASPTFRRHS